LVLVVLSLIALAVWILQKNDGGGVAILIPALAIAIPAAIVGVLKLTGAHRSLAGPDRPRKKRRLVTQVTNSDVLSAAATDPLEMPQQSTPASVTENTTLNFRLTREGSDGCDQ
jgi:hypothetical protein